MKGLHQGSNGASSSPEGGPEPLPSFDPDEPDIPELEGKKKEEEEKKRGAAWLSGIGPRGGDLLLGGARAGASSAARSGVLGSGRIAAALSDLFGGSGTFLGGIFASKIGGSLVLGGMLAWGGVVLVAGFSLLGRMGGGPQGAKGSGLSVGMDGSGIVIDAPKNRSLNFLSNANQGELMWDKDNPQPQGNQETAKEPEQDSVQEAEQGQEDKTALAQTQGGSDWQKSFGSDGKLASGKFSFQGKGAGAGGAGLVAGGGAGGTPGAVSGKGPPMSTRVGGGRLSAAPRGAKRHASKAINIGRGRSGRAMGQAKLARTMSGKGSTASGDASARQYAADAFDQSATRGGDLNAPPGGGGDDPGVVVPPGTGAPEVDNTLPNPPDAPPPTNATPYQNQLDAAKGMGMQAAMLKMLSIMLILMGLGLIAAGIALLNNHTTFPIGIALIAMGVALVAMGIMMLMMAQQMAAAAKGMGDQIKNQYGQDEQGQVVDECSDQSVQSGTAPENCKPATKPDHKTPQVKENIEKERNSNYTIEEGAQPQ